MMDLFKDKLSSGSIKPFWLQTAGLMLIATAYWVVVRLGLLFVVQPENVASIWPASGLSLAILLLSPKHEWGKLLTVIFLANVTGNFSYGTSLPISLGFALANALEALLGAWILTYFCKSKITFGRTMEVFVLFGVAILSNGITAMLGALVPVLAFGVPFLQAWLAWWAADGLGMILVTPFIVSWATGRNIFQARSPRRLFEIILNILALIIFTWLIFGTFTKAEDPLLRNYMLFPILIWLAFRFSPRGIASALVLFTVIALSNTLQGYGIFSFAEQTVTENLESVQIFLSVTAFSGLLLSAMVSERKQVEETSYESANKILAVFRAVEDGITVANMQGQILESNDAAVRLHGFENREEFLDKNIAQLVSETDRERMVGDGVAIMQNAGSGVFEYMLQKKDGSLFNGELRLSKLNDREESPPAIIAITRDITNRKHAEEALKESEARFRLLSDVSLEGIQIHDNGIILDANLALAKQLGYRSPDELIGKQIMEKHLTPESLKRTSELIARKVEGAYEVEGIRNDGTHFPVEITSYTLNLNGKNVRIASTRDITERKKAEENIRDAEAKYRTLIEKIPPIVYISGLHQHIGVNYISPRIQSLGYTPEEWIADPELWFKRVHREDRSKVADEIQLSIRDNKPFNFEYRLVARDGSIRWFLDEAVDIFDDAGKPIFRQGFMLDITDRKTAEEALLSREKFLALLNEMTRTILLSDDYDAIMQALAINMTKIIDADDCYILRWNEEKQQPIPVITTAKLDFPFSEANANEISITASILEAGHVLVVEDVSNSPYVSVEVSKQYPARSIAGVPLIAANHKLGVAIIAFNTHHQFTQEDVNRAEQAGNQIALALWNFQQSLEIQHRLKESNALAEIGRSLNETERVGSEKVLQLIVDSARELIQQASESVIHLLDTEEQTLIPKAISGYTEETKAFTRPKMHMGEGVSGQAMRTGQTINVGNINTSPLFLIKDSTPTFRSLLVAPVRIGGQQIGTISVQSSKINAFSTRDTELLNAFSVQAAIAIENSNLFESTQQRLKEVNALYRTSQGLASSLNTDELIKDVVNLLQENFGYYHAQIYLLDPSNGNLILKHSSGDLGAKLLEQGFYLPKGTGIVGHVAETAIPFATNDVHEVVFYFNNPLLPETQSELAVPIKVDDVVVGILDVQHKHPNWLTESDLQLMTAVAGQLSVSLEKANLYANLQTALEQEQTIRSQLLQSERLALVGRLLASVSHELNNPLQAIQNALFLLKDEENLSVQGKQDLDVILSEAERMASLIERLRSAYRPVRIKDFQPVELNGLIEDVHTLISTHMRQREIVFEFFPDTDLPYVSGIPDQIRQVALNLFINAIEAMKPKGRLTILTKNLFPQNEVLFMVKDTGPGVDPDILPIIFDPFITNKNAGTGLGLTITHDIIEQHHGRIEVENVPEGGAVFKIWLPIHEKGRE